MWSEYESKTSKEHQKKVQSWGKSTLWVNVRPAVLISKYIPGMCLIYIFTLSFHIPRKKGFLSRNPLFSRIWKWCTACFSMPLDHRCSYEQLSCPVLLISSPLSVDDMLHLLFILPCWTHSSPELVMLKLFEDPSNSKRVLFIWIHLLAHHKKQTNLRFVLKENTKNAILFGWICLLDFCPNATCVSSFNQLFFGNVFMFLAYLCFQISISFG